MPRRFSLLLTTGLLASLMSPAWADDVKISAGEHSGFGRMTFVWPAGVGFNVKSDKAGAAISFNRPIKADMQQAQGKLPSYLSSAKVVGDGRTVQFGLRNAFELRALREGTSIVVDFWPPKQGKKKPDRSATGTDASKPKPIEVAPPAAKAEQRIELSAGPQKPSSDEPAISVAEKPDFTRIVFPWSRLHYKIEHNGPELILVFQIHANPDLTPLKADKPKGLEKAAGRAEGDTYRLSLWLSEGYAMRRFSDDGRLVVDLVAPKSTVSKQAEAAATASKPDSDAASRKKGNKQPSQEKIGKPAKSEGEPKPAKQAKDAKSAKGKDTKTEAPEAPKVARAKPQAAKPVELTASPQPAAKGPGLNIERAGKGARLTVSWTHPVPGAVFERAGKLWVVLGERSKLDLSALPLQHFAGIGTIEQVPNSKATVLRMPLETGFSAVPSVDGAQWQVDILPQVAATAPQLSVWPEPNAPGGARLRVEAPQAYGPIAVADPEVGDSLTVVAIAPGHGLASKRTYVDLALLPSSQGLVVERRNDAVEVRTDGDSVTLSAPGGLTLSAIQTAVADDSAESMAPAPAEEQPAAAVPAPKKPDAKGPDWRDEPAPDFAAKRNALELQVAQAAEPDRTRRRFELVQLYLRSNLPQEAFGILNAAAEQDPGFAASGAYHVARGQAEVLMRRYADADKDLSAPEATGDRDAWLWRTAALAGLGKWTDAAQAFASGEAALGQYPPRFQARFQLAAAQAAFETDDLDRAKTLLGQTSDDLPKPLANGVALAKAKILEKTEGGEHALKAYRRVADLGDGPSAAEARLRATQLALKLGRMSRAEAIASLEKLRYAWRGDDTELNTMGALGDLYLADGRYRDAFAEYAEAGRAFPDSPVADRVQDRMKEAFADLFLHGKADKMEPVKALGLFLDNRDLTPVGRDGDDMIRKLADRLASVDLLDQAETLLDYQIHNRLDEGVAKAQVAAKLAALALLNHDPKRALQAIRETRQARLPDDLNEKRRVLEAQAQMELGAYDEALELLDRFATPEAETLRAEIHWRSRHWPEAAASMMALLAHKPQGAALAAEDRQTLMKAAISYALAGDQAGLETLRGRYGAQMAKSPDKDGFDVLTGPVDVSGVAFRELAAKIAGLDSLQGLLKSYREKL